MGEKTGISWCDATWNPVIGCNHVSAGCDNCYARKVAMRFAGNFESPGYYFDVVADDGYGTPVGWNGRVVRRDPKFNPLAARKPRTIFACSMGDLFHSGVPDEWIDDVMAVISWADHHRYMILTKRPERMQKYFLTSNRCSIVADAVGMMMEDGDNAHDYVINNQWPPKSLALGVSVENQQTADERIPILLQTPAARHFVSIEPMLGPVDLTAYLNGGLYPDPSEIGRFFKPLDLVIFGGESGPKARPMHPDWARSMRDQCQGSEVPFHFKQWGEWIYNDFSSVDTVRLLLPERIGKSAAGRLLDGIEHNGGINWEG